MGTTETRLFTAVLVLILIGIVGSFTSPTGYQVYNGGAQANVPPVPSYSSQPSSQSAAVSGTTLENALQFLRSFGFFSVILPFLLVFTIVFGVLEKTRIFGTEKIKGEDLPRRNLNSVVSFCIAFFVVAASNVVQMLQVSLPIVALLLIVIIVFLLLFGALMGKTELEGGISLWKFKGFKGTFVVAIVVAVLAIMLAGFGLLGTIVTYVSSNLTGTFITSLILFVIVVGAMWFVVGSRAEKKEGGT